jgi:uncharacterized iron-regulated protein
MASFSGLTLLLGAAIGIASAAAISACSPQTREQIPPAPTLVKPMTNEDGTPSGVASEGGDGLDAMIGRLEQKRVVFVGETHDRYDHHLNQLAVIRGLHERGVDLAIGMEAFQEPYQAHLDRYVAGDIDEKVMLKRTQYYDRWRYDVRLYRDILDYARENAIPLVALNAPTELVKRVSEGGLAALGPEDRAGLPADLAPPDTAYEGRLRPIFEMHGKVSADRLRRFTEVQVLWDEYMARVARDYLKANSDKTLVVLAGSGHVAYADAIPGRLKRMTGADYAVVATASDGRSAGPSVDYLFAGRDIDLPQPGRVGMKLAGNDLGVTVSEIAPTSPAAEAGFRPGDLLLSIAGERVQGMEDVRLALLDRAPGDQLWVEVVPSADRAAARREGRLLTLL